MIPYFRAKITKVLYKYGYLIFFLFILLNFSTFPIEYIVYL